jgi:ABC-2 type transport system permease protein
VTLGLLAGVMLASVLWATLQIAQERQQREGDQARARAHFLAQPARHPHRMVHYGQYVHRVPPPLAALEPGLDAYTGRSIFLEGHRQNTATFAAVQETSLLARFGDLSPSFIVQAVVPLALILLGYASVVRERETGALVQLWTHGVRPSQLLAGKALALFVVVGLALMPMAAAGVYALLGHRDEALPAAVLLFADLLYLCFWLCAVLVASSLARRRWAALSGLLACWVLLVVIVPRVAADFARASVPVEGVTDRALAVGDALRAAGDGHDARDPAFARFTRETLERYGARSIEELPINFRGLAMMEGERRSAAIQQRDAERRMAEEAAQADVSRAFAVLTPALALRWASMSGAGTDLAGFHRFLVAAEAYRYALVQELNALHAHALQYVDDLRRSSDADAAQRTRIAAEHWAALPQFEFAPTPPAERLVAARPALLALLGWFAAGLVVLRRAVRQLARTV